MNRFKEQKKIKIAGIIIAVINYLFHCSKKN